MSRSFSNYIYYVYHLLWDMSYCILHFMEPIPAGFQEIGYHSSERISPFTEFTDNLMVLRLLSRGSALIVLCLMVLQSTLFCMVWSSLCIETCVAKCKKNSLLLGSSLSCTLIIDHCCNLPLRS
jgi:hypothetical protein